MSVTAGAKNAHDRNPILPILSFTYLLSPRTTNRHLAAKEAYQQAYQLMQEMRAKIPNVNIAYYINMKIIETVHKALDIPLGRGQGAERNAEEEIPEDV